MLCFFFSSRRRHTSYWRDWSSDVCSSDLDTKSRSPIGLRNAAIGERLFVSARTVDHHVSAILRKLGVGSQIGRASGREREQTFALGDTRQYQSWSLIRLC